MLGSIITRETFPQLALFDWPVQSGLLRPPGLLACPWVSGLLSADTQAQRAKISVWNRCAHNVCKHYPACTWLAMTLGVVLDRVRSSIIAWLRRGRQANGYLDAHGARKRRTSCLQARRAFRFRSPMPYCLPQQKSLPRKECLQCGGRFTYAASRPPNDLIKGYPLFHPAISCYISLKC